MSDADRNCLVGVQLTIFGVRLKEIGQILRGCARDRIEADSCIFVLNAMCDW